MSWAGPVLAQTVTPESYTRPFLQSFTRKDYDASTQNWSVQQDARGVIYVGNSQGVLEYDGASWRLIKNDNQTAVRAIKMAGDSTLFVGGSSDLGFLKPDSLGVMQYQSLMSHIPVDDRDFGHVWFIHALPEGIYFQAVNHLFLWDGNAMTIRRPNHRFNTSGSVHNTLYVHSYEDGLMRMEGDSLHLIPGSERFAREWIFVMLPFDSQRVFLGTRDQGFFLFDGETFTPFPTDVDEFLLKYTLYLPGTMLADGNIALGTSDAGLLVLDRQGRLLHHYDEDSGLINKQVFYVFQDEEQGLWLALNNGITRLELPAPLSYIDDEMGLPQNILCMETHNGTLYIGTRTGMFYLDEVQKRVLPVAEADNSVWNMITTPEALYATTNGGVYRVVDGEAVRWEMFKDQPTNEYYAYSLHQSRLDSSIMFIGKRQGFDVIRFDDTAPAQWEILGTIPDIDDQASTIHELTPGQLMLGMRDGVVQVDYTLYELLVPDVTRYDTANGLPAGAVSAYALADQLYYMTHDGVFTFEPAEQSFTRADSQFPGLSFEDAVTFGNITEGVDGSAWISTKAGVHFAIPASGGGYDVRSAPFLHTTDWTINSIVAGNDNSVWMGGIDGLIRYGTDVEKPYDVVHSPILSRIAVGADSVVFGGAGAPMLDNDGASSDVLPTFAYANNNIRFDFQAPLYDLPEEVRYQVALEGFDEQWTDWSAEVWRAYTNLRQGDYQFKVRARNAYGSVSEPATYNFSIAAPWWATTKAFVGYGLALLGLIMGLNFVQRRRLIARERLRAEREKARAVEATNTELQKALKNLTEAQDQLIHAEKMASLGQLTAGIAHEIKNPLNFVNNFAQLCADQTEEIEQIIEKYQDQLGPNDANDLKFALEDLNDNVLKINEHGQRADGIIRSMLEHSRTGRGERRRININRLVDEYVTLAYHGVKARMQGLNVELNRQYDEDVGEVEITAQEIGRVLINLLDNALYAVAEKQAAGVQDYTPTIYVKTLQRSGFVEVHIRDNGVGVPADLREKIFEPFFTTKPTGSGTGLGLSLSHDIVVSGHSGKLALSSEEGNGTTVVMMLPC